MPILLMMAMAVFVKMVTSTVLANALNVKLDVRPVFHCINVLLVFKTLSLLMVIVNVLTNQNIWIHTLLHAKIVIRS